MTEIGFRLNGKDTIAEVSADLLLIDLLRRKGCCSVKRGCETSGCGLCTVLLNGKPVLSCSVLAVRADEGEVITLEGVGEQAQRIGAYLAGEGADQCGYCSPGLIMNVIAMEKELFSPGEEEIREYLAGNLCRCSGYMGQLRAVAKYLNREEGA